MTSQAGQLSPLPLAHHLPPQIDRDAFAEMFDAHAQHVFDYCCGLLGDHARAASATQVTLVAAHSLSSRLRDRDRMRAWLLALARRECLPASPEPGVHPPPDADLADALAVVGETDSDVAEPDTSVVAVADIEAAGAGCRYRPSGWR